MGRAIIMIIINILGIVCYKHRLARYNYSNIMSSIIGYKKLKGRGFVQPWRIRVGVSCFTILDVKHFFL